jgi:hypothetical protein
MSASYRQSSAFVGTPPDVDPENRWLYRAPRFRLSAEEVRDNALRIAGLLSSKVGGPSVMPHQPSDFYKGKNESWTWSPSEGDDRFRRGLYTFWRRTSLHPMFAIFDASTREECSVARPRTNTPLQALVTMNDPTFVEAARQFAVRITKEGPGDVAGRLRFAFQTALVREPSAVEHQVLQRQYEALKARYEGQPQAATALVGPTGGAEQAAWMGLATVLLNLD